MDIDDTTDDSVWDLIHQTNDKTCIGENAKVTQHDPEFENSNDEEHLEAPHRPILAENSVKKFSYSSERKCTRRSYKVSASLLIFPI